MFETRPGIFLIDDDNDDLELLSSSLEEQGNRVTTFTSGAQALSYFNEVSVYIEMPSLIIVDYNMPLMNGFETLIRIKKNKKIRQIPVVMYSTTVSPLFEKDARNFGAVACMTKAYNIKDFEEHVLCFTHLASSFQENISSATTKL